MTTALSFIQSALGVPFDTVYGRDAEQDPSYWTGNGLGWLPEEVVAEILSDAAETNLLGDASTGFTQRFEKLDYVVVNFWAGEVFGSEQAQQGRFEFELTPGPNHEIRINVPWKLNIQSGVTESEANIIAGANLALGDYWTGHAPNSAALVSRNDGLVVPIVINVKVVSDTENFAWDIKVYPDSAHTVEHAEVVWMADFSWSMRETFSFRPREDNAQRAGRGPHEVGHMIGIPHDVNDRFTVMSTIDAPGFNHWRLSLGGDSNPVLRPYAAHFKLAKVWADMVFAQMGRLEDFYVRLPEWT